MKAVRLPGNPIITPSIEGYDPDRLGTNINGPSLIRVPDWIERPLGRYYLYFAHHQGKQIRLAYADELTGPWRLHEPGTLALEASGFVGHVASPDVHVDHDRRRLRMYFHGPATPEERERDAHRHVVPDDFPWPGSQYSRVATSADGIDFDVREPVIATYYLRVFFHGGWHYGITMPFNGYRSRDGLGGWELGPTFFDYRIRHGAAQVVGDTLRFFFSRREDCPERIMLTTVDLARPWDQWEPTEPVTVLEPETPWEGANEPLAPSASGAVHESVRQLRDPAVYEEDGRVYLLYSVAGEAGIAIAELEEES